jgi:DNA mismatch repair ATPase MutS
MFRSNVIVLQDDKLSQAAREMEAAGLVHIMKLYQNFIKDMLSYFENLRSQIAFYIGCANLHNRLTQLHIPVSMPYVNNEDMKGFKFRGLYDMSMAIYNREQPVTNDLETEDLLLFLITGANQGGKSTYLRSIGIAQILMQCGMFVPADYYCSSLCRGIYTHFTRREDTAMNSGKLDEELSRMNRIIHNITPGSMLLMNESFATTTEREGSVIASDIVKALYEHGVRILMVTHLFEFTKYMYEHRLEQSMFLSAQRLSDGTRTFKILEQEPERTSYGLDLYDNILGNK